VHESAPEAAISLDGIYFFLGLLGLELHHKRGLLGQMLLPIWHHTFVRYPGFSAALLVLIAASGWAQTSQTAAPDQAPTTAPQTAEVLPSYEGQNVVSVELAGQPELDTRDLVPLLKATRKRAFRAGQSG
jgi:hypothetical protein